MGQSTQNINKVLKKKRKEKSNHNTARTLQSQITKACFLGNKSLVKKKIVNSPKKQKIKKNQLWQVIGIKENAVLSVFACKHQKLVWVKMQCLLFSGNSSYIIMKK